MLGYQLTGNLFLERGRKQHGQCASDGRREDRYMVRCFPRQPYVTFQHPGIKFLHLLTGRVAYRYGPKVVRLSPEDSLQFDATAPHEIDDIEEGPVSYLSVVFTIRE